jgi:hypothetical protein
LPFYHLSARRGCFRRRRRYYRMGMGGRHAPVSASLLINDEDDDMRLHLRDGRCEPLDMLVTESRAALLSRIRSRRSRTPRMRLCTVLRMCRCTILRPYRT